MCLLKVYSDNNTDYFQPEGEQPDSDADPEILDISDIAVTT